MAKNKKSQKDKVGNPNRWEEYQPGHASTPEKDVFSRDREKVKTAQGDASMSSRRLFIIVDNVIAAGLFAFFSVWINVYLGLEGYVEDFGSSVSMTITDVRLNLLETLLYFSLYLVLLWRSPEKIGPMSLDVYFKKYMPIALVILLVIVLGGYLACRRLMVERMGCADGNYPFIPSILRWTILSTLFYYRHFILSWLATKFTSSRG